MTSACREVLERDNEECRGALTKKLGNLQRFELEQFSNKYAPDGLKYKPENEGRKKLCIIEKLMASNALRETGFLCFAKIF